MRNSELTLTGLALLPDGVISEATIHISNGTITQVSRGADPQADIQTTGTILPGFIDLQLNGAFGYDFTLNGASVAAVSERLPSTGVTSFIPTIITSPFKDYPVRLSEIAGAMQIAKGAQPLGVHLEGPYLNPAKRGAHDAAYMRPIDLDEILGWADPALVRIVTLAPELPGALEAIRALRNNGITVSLGHSNATLEQANAGFEAGANWATHLYNAMSPPHHREPGLTGAILTSSVPCGLIPDGVHVHPSMVKLAFHAKGVNGITLVTDAMEALGMPSGIYRLGDREVHVSEDRVQLADGTLAGSKIEMDAAVRNMMAFSGCTLAQAASMASLIPAQVLGLDRKGAIGPGYGADLVILDQTLHVSLTIVAGKLSFERSPV